MTTPTCVFEGPHTLVLVQLLAWIEQENLGLRTAIRVQVEVLDPPLPVEKPPLDPPSTPEPVESEQVSHYCTKHLYYRSALDPSACSRCGRSDPSPSWTGPTTPEKGGGER